MPGFRFRVTGRVQGVGYRAFVQRNATALGVTGTVRNERDGAVTGVAHGSEEQLERFWRKLEKGPLFGRVDGLEVDAVGADARDGAAPSEFSIDA